MRALLRRLARNRGLPAIAAVPRRDAMPPPQLAGDTPVVDVLHPLQVDGAVVVGRDADMAFGDGPGGRLRQAHAAPRRCRLLVDGDKPLLGEPRLHNGLAAVALADGVDMIFSPSQ